MSGTLEMLLGNIDFPNEQHSAVSISIFYFKFKVIPRKDVWRCREKKLFKFPSPRVLGNMSWNIMIVTYLF